jgi:hypothetical protein
VTKQHQDPANPLEQLVRIRAWIAKLRAERETLEISAVPPAEFVERVKAELGRQAAAFDRELMRALSPLRAAKPERPFIGVGLHGIAELVRQADVGPLLAAIAPDALLARVTAAIEDGRYPSYGPPAAERPGLLAELEQHLLDAEQEEERLVEQCEALGLPVLRRADARASIVLGVPGGEPEPAAAA